MNRGAMIDKSNVIIKPITLEDVPAFVGHMMRNLRTSGLGDTGVFSPFSRTIPMHAGAMIENIRESFSRDTSAGWERGWGAWDQESGVMIGEVDLSTIRNVESQRHRATLGMGIEPDYRYLGIGKTLVNEALVWAKAQPFLKWIDIGVFAHNAPARRLYEGLGFIERGRTKDCFRVDGHSVDDIQMVLDLDQLR